MYFIIGLFLVAANLLLYMYSRRLFFLSVFAVYPIVSQMVSVDIDLFGAKINVSMLYGSLLFTVCVIEFLQQIPRYGISRDKGLTLISVLFLLSCFASVGFSTNQYETVTTSMKVSTWVLLILVTRRVFREETDLALTSRLALVSSGIITLLYIASKLGIYGNAFGGYKYYDYKIDVAMGNFYSAVAMAYPLVICVPIILIGYFVNQRKIWIAAVFTNLLVILFTYVRTPLVALVFAFVVFAYSVGKYRIRRFSMLFITGGIAFILIFLLFQQLNPGNATKRWTELQDQVHAKQYGKLGSGRFGLAMNALNFQFQKQTLLGHLFGIGVGNTGSISKSGKIVHNSYLEVWLGCGIIGLILYFSFMLSLWRNIRLILQRSKDKRLQMAGALAVMNFCIFVVSSFDVIITAVFPMSLLAIHIGATLGVAQAKEVEVAANTTFAEQHNQTILMEGVYGCRP